MEKATKINNELSNLKKSIEKYNNLSTNINDSLLLLDILSDNDFSLILDFDFSQKKLTNNSLLINYIIYDEKTNINYIYLLFFMSIAEYNPASNRYDIVRYKSIKKLADTINEVCGDNSISTSTLNRLLDRNE